MTKDEELFQKRLIDLAGRASLRGIIQYSDFMNLNELNIFHNSAQKFSFVDWKTFGGYEDAQRQMAAFLPDAFSFCEEQEILESFPLGCVHIRSLNEKFSDELTHRDYLGAILNLGIERSKIGDILVVEKEAYVFCTLPMCDYLSRELCRVRHTSIQCVTEEFKNVAFTQKTELIKGSIASVRLDSLLALAYQGSRTSLTSLIESGRVFVNGRLITSNGYNVKDGDLISARGFGRFRYCGVCSHTKKGRCFVEIEKYM